MANNNIIANEYLHGVFLTVFIASYITTTTLVTCYNTPEQNLLQTFSNQSDSTHRKLVELIQSFSIKI